MKRQKGRFIMMQGAILIDITQKSADKERERRELSAREGRKSLKAEILRSIAKKLAKRN
jgi:hypothetical protein